MADRERRRPGIVQRRGGSAILALLAFLVGDAAAAATAGTGVVAGVVTAGRPRSERTLPVVKHAEVCGKQVADDRLVVGPGGGLRYAVVTIDGVRGGAAPERDVTSVLDNQACRFVPHVQVAEVGQWLELRNSDPILHNADAWIGQEPIFNVALPPGGVKRKPLARPGLVAIKCDVGHTWMNAFVDVAEHPYHTVTDAYGAYEIREVPPGSYTLRVWHEELGTLERPLVVEAGERTTVDVGYAAATPGKE
jgi:hypothetical protein